MPMGEILGGLFSFPQEETATPESKSSAPKTNAKLQKAAAEIVARPEETEAAYLARELVQCTLPHRNPGKVNGWKRSNGNFHLVCSHHSIPKLWNRWACLTAQSAFDLLWIVTEAVRTKNPHLKLGDTLNDFLREIGLDPNTGRGKRGDATRVKDQMMKLLRCRIRL